MLSPNNIKNVIDIKNYEQDVKIGFGQYGTIYKVVSKTNQVTYAAKILKFENDDDDIHNERELRIMSFAKHPTIIKYIGYSKIDFNGDNKITIIMELAQNGSLADIIKKIKNKEKVKDFNNTTKQIILAGVARGMKYLHDNDIVHRDLKPGNILLDEHFYPRISDFGLSKFFESDDFFNNSSNIGTPAYMAPELIENEKYDKKVDVYSFGIVMYEIVTNLSPYPEYETTKRFQKFNFFKDVIDGFKRPNIELWDGNPHLKQLIESCWSSNSIERPTFDELFEKLSNFNTKRFFLNDVDVDQFKAYLDYINRTTNPRKNKFMPKIKVIDDPVVESKNKKTEKMDDDEPNDYVNNLKRKVSKLSKDNKQLKDENKKLLEEVKRLKSQIDSIDKENQILKLENTKLKKNNNKKEIDDSSDTKEDYNLNENMLISDFNNLKLKEQQIISAKISKMGFIEKNIFFKKINNLELYLMKYDDLTESCIEIDNNKEEHLYDIRKSRLVFLRYFVIEKLIDQKEFDFPSLYNLLNEFDKICLELRYPSYTFKDKYKFLFNIIKRNRSRFKLSIFITETDDLDQTIFQNDKNISYVRFNTMSTLNLTQIYESTFKECTSLIKITIPSSVKQIKQGAFEGCSSLQQIDLHQSIREIEPSVFEGCSSLQEITIPSSVIKIENKLFKGCSSLTKVIIHPKVNEIKFNAFKECSSLSQITLPPNITKIEAGVFDGCSSLSQVSIPFSVKKIGKSAFENCTSLKYITIPNSVETIKLIAFKGCTSLKEIVIPSTIEIIEQGVFKGCTSLTDITIPSSITIIKSEAFKDCTSLKEIEIPSSVESIENSAFEGCTSLTDITIPESITKIQDCMFKNCQSLVKLIIPSSINEIGPNAFENCSSLKEITIPFSVTSIGRKSFLKCTSLTEISIPFSVKSIGSYAFSDCSSLIDISLPSSIEVISEGQFCNCTSLKEISIPSSVIKIKPYAFDGCSSLENIDIPSSVKSIQRNAFNFCTSLKQMTIPNSVFSVEKYAFQGCNSLKQLNIPSIVYSDNLAIPKDTTVNKTNS